MDLTETTRPVLHPLVEELLGDERLVAYAEALPAPARVSEPALPLLLAALHEHLGRALELERDPMRRAALYGRLAEMHYSRWEGDKALNRVAQGLAELGHPLPRHSVALAASTLAQLVAGFVMGLLPRRIRSVTGTTRERYRLRARLHDIGKKPQKKQDNSVKFY